LTRTREICRATDIGEISGAVISVAAAIAAA
jgi:hypothetical protein